MTLATMLDDEIWSYGIAYTNHYENKPIQIYRKFLLQKLNIFR